MASATFQFCLHRPQKGRVPPGLHVKLSNFLNRVKALNKSDTDLTNRLHVAVRLCSNDDDVKMW